MHYHLEIVMPPVDDVEKAIEQIMKPFQEGSEDEDASGTPFWDWYVVGGRYAGSKIQQRFPEERMDKFYEALKEAKVTVSGMQWGKQEISPADQIPMVDRMWREHFPDGGEVCPIFKHYNDQFKTSKGWPDVATLKETPVKLKAARIIFAALDHEDKELTAVHMVQDSFWNGVNHADTKWDGTLASAVADFGAKLKNYREEYAKKVTPADDWLCVTVDYHS